MGTRIVTYTLQFKVEVDDSFEGEEPWDDIPQFEDVQDLIMKKLVESSRPNLAEEKYRFVWDTVSPTEQVRSFEHGQCLECAKYVLRRHQSGRARLHRREILTAEGRPTGQFEWCPGSNKDVREPSLRERCRAGGHRPGRETESGTRTCACQTVEYDEDGTVITV
jgi:hypothetical protein